MPNPTRDEIKRLAQLVESAYETAAELGKKEVDCSVLSIKQAATLARAYLALREQVETEEKEKVRIRELFIAEMRWKYKWAKPARGYSCHSHNKPGIWDSDNGDIAGKECGACASFKYFVNDAAIKAIEEGGE